MWEYEFDDDDLEDEDEARLPVDHRASKWMVLGAFFELMTDIAKAWAKLFDALADESLAKYRRQRNRDEFIQQASREIEKLTSGDYDATTVEARSGFGTGASES